MKNMILKNSRAKVAAGIASAAIGAAVLISACSGGTSADGGSTAASLTISGGFSGLSVQSLKQMKGGVQTFAATDYTVICSMMVSPFTSGYSALQDDGTFSLTITGGSGQPIGCMIVKAGKRVADFEFTSATDGMTSATGGAALAVNSGATTITLPTTLSISSDVVSVDTSAVVQDSTTAPTVTWADPTGTWSITGACQTELNADGIPTTTCNAAQGGDIPTSVYLKQLEATKNGVTQKGLSVWASETARTACGGKEGITLDNGWTATGSWDGAFQNAIPMLLNDSTNVNTIAALAKVQIWEGKAVCDKTNVTAGNGGGLIVSGTTLCSQVDWTGGGWGMSADACKLYCIMGALSSGGDSNNFTDASSCKKRYRARWENNAELSSDSDYNGGNGSQAGEFSSGLCDDTTFDGCKDQSSGKVLFEMEKANDQHMIGELFISGNVGSLVQKHHFQSNFPNATNDGVVSCGGTHVEKMTMTQTSATTATVNVEHSFIADSANDAACATNEHFSHNANDESSMVLKLQK